MERRAKTKQEADADLQEIRQSRGAGRESPEDDDVLTNSLDKALKTLSNRLNKTSTSFLLELIQNADDNLYRGVVPTLHLKLSAEAGGPSYFRADCNEVGFSRAQLSALLHVGQSTKTAMARGHAGRVGDKGIGFKSVFQVADVVHVASGYYEFKLDRRQPRGMILPIPEPFPLAQRVSGHTQVLLPLNAPAEHYDDILHDLQHIEPQVLLFLRRLRRLQVSTPQGTRVYECRHVTFDASLGHARTTTLTERRLRDGHDGRDSHDGHDGQTTAAVQTKYVVYEHVVQDMPAEPRRKGGSGGGVRASEVILAFPIANDDDDDDKEKGGGAAVVAADSPQQTFAAFLPVGDCGFPFVIRADFLRVAGRRQGLAYGSPWNRALQAGIVDACVQAVQRMIQIPETRANEGLCYDWPRYLARRPSGASFWDTLHASIVARLRTEPVLLSLDNSDVFYPPAALRYIARPYCLDGVPLLNEHPSARLSFLYDHVREPLRALGVQTLAPDELCAELEWFVRREGAAGLAAKDPRWHAQLASLLSGQPSDQRLRQRLRTLPLVPLRDGTWVEAASHPVYLTTAAAAAAADDTDTDPVPSGLGIALVDPAVSRDTARRGFLQFLGLSAYDPAQGCRLIGDLHRNALGAMAQRSDDEIVADAVYLYRYRLHPSCPSTVPSGLFCLVRQNGVRRRLNTNVYCLDPSRDQSIVAKYKDTPGCPFAVLDPAYASAVGAAAAQDFVHWLLLSPAFAAQPRLWSPEGATAEFDFLRETSVIDLLRVVQQTVSPGAPMDASFAKAVSQLAVPCRNDRDRALCQTALPTNELRASCPHQSFVAIEDAHLDTWQVLSRFGVMTTCNTTARLRELRTMSKGKTQSKDTANTIYRALSEDPDGKAEIVAAFQRDPLIYVEQPEPRWVRPRDCVWSAPTLLKKTARLDLWYSDCQRLFATELGVASAGLDHIVDELCSFGWDGEDPEAEFLQLLAVLDDYSRGGSQLTADHVAQITAAAIFPIVQRQVGSAKAGLRWSSIAEGDWFIPDQAPLEAAFCGKVDLLYLDVQVVHALRAIFQTLGCEKTMFLSSKVQCKSSSPGPWIQDRQGEEQLKKRLQCIASLSRTKVPRPTLDRIRVWSTPSITVKRLLDGIAGSPGSELFHISEKKDTTRIYMCDMELCQRPALHFALLQHFAGVLGVVPEDANLANLLMAAPIDQLPAIMAQNGRIIPRELEAGAADGVGGGGEEDAQRGQGLAAVGNGVAVITDHACAAPAPQSGRTATGAQPNAPPPQRLSSLIPSHHADMQSLDARAFHFPMSSVVFTKSPASFPGHCGTTLAVRPRALDPAGREDRTTVVAQPVGSCAISDTPTDRTSLRLALDVSADRTTPPVETKPAGGCGTDTPSLGFPKRSVGSSSQPHSPRPDSTVPVFETAREVLERSVQFKGEYFIHRWFGRQIPDWTLETWTSQLRVEADLAAFAEEEPDFSGFTYLDSSEHMKRLLLAASMEVPPNWTSRTTYHLGVKSTAASKDEPFHLSQPQIDEMRRFDSDPNSVYILIRIFNINATSPGLKFYLEPWKLFLDGALNFISENGYRIEAAV